ncbi:MAG: dihydroorotate dehydrogenase-like protein [Phycisphaeraceae bacterium]|nr:dihydroorotate dehydrogenase-like protein [Phycisphaeraceae bacterium]
MDLSTRYLGFELRHPLIPGASPMGDSLDTVKALEDAGAPMIILRSLFEEQIKGEEMATYRSLEEPANSFAEASDYLPRSTPGLFKLGPDEYLDQIEKVRRAVAIPLVGSLNGVTLGGWLEYARLIEQAGADALELNLYQLATDPGLSGDQIEEQALAVIAEVRKKTTLPLSVKLSPFYSALANFAQRAADAGADALVLFNRLYQPDIDLENLEMIRINLSSSDELNLRLRWVAILFGRVKTNLSVSGGVHLPTDAVKAVMAGADSVQMVSALLRRGPGYLAEMVDGLERWLEEKEYDSLGQMRGSMSLLRCPDPSAYERANYSRMLQSWEA